MKINSFKPGVALYLQDDTFVTEHHSFVAEINFIHDVYVDGFLTKILSDISVPMDHSLHATFPAPRMFEAGIE